MPSQDARSSFAARLSLRELFWTTSLDRTNIGNMLCRELSSAVVATQLPDSLETRQNIEKIALFDIVKTISAT